MARPRPLDPADHLRRPWRVHALARAEGFALHDVWEVDTALPPGTTLALWADTWRQERQGAATRALFALRRALGRVLGLDTQLAIPEELSILCGLAVGYPDPDFPANKAARRPRGHREERGVPRQLI